MKKTLVLLLAFVMLCGVCPAAAAEETVGLHFDRFLQVRSTEGSPFRDVSDTDWFGQDVRLGYGLGLIKGKDNGLYAPGDNVTVAESIALAARLHSIYNTGAAEFAQGSPWYAVYVDYAI